MAMSPMGRCAFTPADAQGKTKVLGLRPGKYLFPIVGFGSERDRLVDESNLIEKLRRVQALFEGGATPGERRAAAAAIERIRERLAETKHSDPPIEIHFSMVDMWSRRLFTALLRRYGVKPYRYSGQRRTTVMARVQKQFCDETLWPEFTELNKVLRDSLDEITDRVIRESVFDDDSEAEVRGELSAGTAQ